MKFKQYILQEEAIKDWEKYVKRIPMLKVAIEVMKKLQKYGDIYIVGGAVRDIITGEKSPDDIDLATNIDPEIIEDNFKIFDIGKNKDFGVTVIKYKGFEFEIAQFRTDNYQNELGKGASTVKIISNFKDDAARRDFQINAIAVDSEGNIIDHFEGIKAIQNKIIKTVGDPKERFKEDNVRMLRAVRFSSRLGFDIDKETSSAIQDMAQNIENVAPERIVKELLKMADQSGDKFADAIMKMKDTGLLKYILPEVLKLDDFEHDEENHPEGNVWDHTIAALKANKLKDPIINLATLLHDIGKIKTYKNQKGKHTYYNHAKESVNIIIDIADRLRLDNKTKKALIFSAENHMKMHDFFDMSNNKIMKLIQNDNWDLLYNVAMLDDKARQHLFNNKKWEDILKKVSELNSRFNDQKSKEKIKKIVNGDIVMKLTGLKQGKKVGDIIKSTIEWIYNNNININNTKQIHDYIKELI